MGGEQYSSGLSKHSIVLAWALPPSHLQLLSLLLKYLISKEEKKVEDQT